MGLDHRGTDGADPRQTGADMRFNARTVPWLLALLGLAIPLVGTGFVVWPLTAVWVVILVLIRLVGRATLPRDHTLRMGYAAGLLPVLFLLGWEGRLVADPSGCRLPRDRVARPGWGACGC